MDANTDIDIDFVDPAAALNGLRHAGGVLLNEQTGQREEHASAVYFQDIPTDPLDGRAAWAYKEAEARGYFKVDFLKSNTYDGVRDEAHLVQLLTTEPPWERLLDQHVVEKLTQINKHHDVIQMMEPRSIQELAVCLALIRPDKVHLKRRPRDEILNEIWKQDTNNGYRFKKSHAVAFASSIVVQLNLLVEKGLA